MKGGGGGGGGGGSTINVAEVTPMHVIALVLVQLSYGGFHVMSKYALQEGVNRYVFCAYRDVVAVAALLTFAAVKRCFCHRRRRATPSSTPRHHRNNSGGRGSRGGGGGGGGDGDKGGGSTLPWGPLLVLAICGVFLNQLAFLKGLALTSPVVAGSLQPSIPIFTFVIAVALGDERLNLRKRDGVVKLVGVLLCVLGAFVTSTYQGDVILRGREGEPAVAAMVAVGAVRGPGEAVDGDSGGSSRSLLAGGWVSEWGDEASEGGGGAGPGEPGEAWAGAAGGHPGGGGGGDGGGGGGGAGDLGYGRHARGLASVDHLDLSVKAAAARRRHHVVGVSFLLGGCAMMAVYLTLQQRVLAKHPHPQSVTCWSYAVGRAALTPGCQIAYLDHTGCHKLLVVCT
jgi:drug/metabolite transporter (DMT)-like permease